MEQQPVAPLSSEAAFFDPLEPGGPDLQGEGEAGASAAGLPRASLAGRGEQQGWASRAVLAPPPTAANMEGRVARGPTQLVPSLPPAGSAW